jgi:protein gp37
MAENSSIEWTDHTMNFWVGCTKVSPACDNCYAESWAKRTGQSKLWNGERRQTTLANRHKAHKWNKQAQATGKRLKVFTNSLADFFDNQVPTQWRREAWHLIEQTPHLDWLILTKRPQNILKMLPDPETGVKPWGNGWPNVWLGTTVENQQEADRRIPHLLNVPALVRFVSAEPLLGPVDFTRISLLPQKTGSARAGIHIDALAAKFVESGLPNWDRWDDDGTPSDNARLARLNWIIVGGESGSKARPMHPDWALSIRDQCAAAGTAFFFKQWGEFAPIETAPNGGVKRSVITSAGKHLTDSALLDYPEDTKAEIIGRFGKAGSGRILDVIQHNAMPEPHI